MPCYQPIPAMQKGPGQSLQLWPPRGQNGIRAETLRIPCGYCIGCKTLRATQWAQRCEHEASQYRYNIFITLTYDDNHLPYAGYLDALALSKFIKNVRQRIARTPDAVRRDARFPTRYFGCGEYGETNGRPHYHTILFNCDFPNARKVGKNLYESDTLSGLWPYGQARYGPATPAAASYIAQYTLKKQVQPKGWVPADGYNGEGYWRSDGTGEETWIPKPAPFLRMSLRPGIGSGWLANFKDDLRGGYLMSGGHRHAIPRTYLAKLKLSDPNLAEDIDLRKYRRQLRETDINTANQHPDRLVAGEKIHEARKKLSEERKL